MKYRCPGEKMAAGSAPNATIFSAEAGYTGNKPTGEGCYDSICGCSDVT